MAKEITDQEGLIAFDGLTYDVSKLTEKTLNQLEILRFVDEQILQKTNEIQVADSARIVYSSVLNTDLKKLKFKAA